MTERDEALRLARDVVALNGEGARGDVALSIAEALLAEHARAEAMRGDARVNFAALLAAMRGVVETVEDMRQRFAPDPNWNRLIEKLLGVMAAIDAHRSGSKS